MPAFDDYASKQAAEKAGQDATPDRKGRGLAIFAAAVVILIGIGILVGVATGVDPELDEAGINSTD